MRKIFLSGRSEVGKTSLTQALKGEKVHYVKTQYTNAEGETIDTPGEYTEAKKLDFALGCYSFDADVYCLVAAADQPFNVYQPALSGWCTRPLIGVITKKDVPGANIPMVRRWLQEAGCERIFIVNNLTGEGIPELRAYLNRDTKKMTLDEVTERQSKGLKDWEI